MEENFRRVPPPPPPPPNFKRPPFPSVSTPQNPQNENVNNAPVQQPTQVNTAPENQTAMPAVKEKRGLSENAKKGLLAAASALSFALAILFFVLFAL